MAFTWILFLAVVQLFSESTCIPVEPTCKDSSLRYGFFLVPSGTEIIELRNFLNNIKSATILEISEDEGVVKIICDPKDWPEIYGFTKDRGNYLLHSTYCIEKNERSALEQFHLGNNKPRKILIDEALDNLIERERNEGQKSDVEKNVRVLETRAAVDSTNNKNGVNGGRLQNAKTLTTKNQSKKTGSENLAANDKQDKPNSPKESSRKSAPKTSKKIPDKTKLRRSVETNEESEIRRVRRAGRRGNVVSKGGRAEPTDTASTTPSARNFNDEIDDDEDSTEASFRDADGAATESGKLRNNETPESGGTGDSKDETNSSEKKRNGEVSCRKGVCKDRQGNVVRLGKKLKDSKRPRGGPTEKPDAPETVGEKRCFYFPSQQYDYYGFDDGNYDYFYDYHNNYDHHHGMWPHFHRQLDPTDVYKLSKKLGSRGRKG